MDDRDIAFILFWLFFGIWIAVSYYGLKLENQMLTKRKRKNDE